MRTAFIVASVLSVIIAIIETLYISCNDIGDVSRISYKPYPLLGIAVLIDGFFFVSMYNELQTGSYLGKINTFYLTLGILIVVLCLMILFIVISSLKSGFFGLGLATINTVIYLLAPIGLAWLFTTVFSEFIRIFGMVAAAAVLFVVAFFVL